MTRRLLRLTTLALVLAVTAASPAAAATLLRDDFARPDGLITNQYAFWHPGEAGVATSPVWMVHSGSFFARGGMGATGRPDDAKPDKCSCNGTGNAVFRLETRRADLGDVDVAFDVINNGLSSTATTPPEAWDGFHVWLRYQSEYSLYYATANRRDNTVIIKKKVPGGPASSNYGTYHDLGPPAPYTVPYGRRQHVRATTRTNADGSVTIALYIDGTKRIEATDRGAGGTAPLTKPGKVGIRGDNADLLFDDFTVTDGKGASDAGTAGPAPAPAAGAPATPGGSPAAAAPAATAARLGSMRLLRGGRVRVRFACAGACSGTLVLQAARTHRRLARKPFALAAAGRGAVTLRLPRALRRRHGIRVRAVAVSATPAGPVRTARRAALRRRG